MNHLIWLVRHGGWLLFLRVIQIISLYLLALNQTQLMVIQQVVTNLSLSSYPLFLSLSLSFFFLPLSSAFFPSLSFSCTTLLSSIGIFHAVHLNAFLSLSISYLLLRSISVCPPHDAANYFPSRRCCNN